jgi:hypothetical protein
MIKRCSRYIALPLLCGGLLFAACFSGPAAGGASGGIVPGLTGGKALTPRAGGWEDIDGLSSASILRAGRGTFGYVDRNGMDGYRIKLVDVKDPAKTLRETLVAGTGRNVAMWAPGPDGRIILVEADEVDRANYTGYNIVVYDQDLNIIASFPYGNRIGLAEAHRARPLNHREPLLALTDRYAIAGWEDKSPVAADPAPNFISVYALADGKSGHIPISGDTANLNIGNLTGCTAQGDYIIAGGSAGTKVLKINASGQAITASVVSSVAVQTPGSHWMQDNGTYVLESVEGNGTIRVWKWNGANAPSLTGVVTVDVASGSVQAVSFDNENPEQAYLLGKVANANAGNVYRVNLATAQAVKLFNVPGFQGGGALAGMWTIQVEREGADTWYIMSGTVAGTPERNGVLVIKNPPVDGSAIDDSLVSASLLDFPTPARSMKAFKSSGSIVYVTKNHPSRNYFADSIYMLRAMRVNGN